MPSYPWQLTLRQFLEKAQRDYGWTLDGLSLQGPQAPVVFEYLERPDFSDLFAVIIELDEDEVLAPSVIRSLCRLLNLPPEDFHLDPED